MTRKERFEAACNKQAPDCMPVFPRAKSQIIYGHGLMLTDVIGQDWYDVEKITEAVISNIREIGYDVAIPIYDDPGFGVPPLGGSFLIPDKFGIAVSNTDDQPVKNKDDWRKIKKLILNSDVKKFDPRMKAALEVIKNVSSDIGDEVALAPTVAVSLSTAMFLFRPDEALLEDVIEDPEWVDEMCKIGTDWAIDWLRANYEAGANSSAMIAEGIGGVMVNPKMNERFNLENIARIVDTLKKEFNKGTWIHLHGDMSRPGFYEYMVKLIKYAKVQGIHFSEENSVKWIKSHVVDELGVSASVVVDGALIANGTQEKIEEEVKKQLSMIGDGLGMIMAPSCQVLPFTKNELFKAWVDATHKYGRYPIELKT